MAKLSYKVSYYVLYVMFAAILVVLGLFYFGGDAQGDAVLMSVIILAVMASAMYKAIQIFEKIINDKTNYVEGAMGMDHTQSQMAFIQGKAAMIPMGAWFESEMRNSLPEEFQAKIMLAPAVTGAKMTNVSVCTSADMMFIPKKSKNVETAMDFLKFMCEDDMLKLFTKYTATPRPFDYDAADVDGLSEFGKSVISAWQSANKVYMYSDNPVYFMKYFYWPFAGAPYSRIQIGDETAQEAFDNDYNFAKDKWNETREELGLS